MAAAGLLALLVLPGHAAPASSSTIVTVDDVRFRNYGVRDGLSQSSARSMLQDATGAVWIGTEDGLNRFDGYEFKVYRADHERPDALPDPHVQVLAPSRRGGFWVGTRAAGIARYRPEQDDFVRYLPAACRG